METDRTRRTATPLDAGRFDPESAETSWTLPAEWYTRPDVYDREHEAIFYRTWWYQCHVSDLSSPGDTFCGEVADRDIFIIRDRDGVLRASNGRTPRRVSIEDWSSKNADLAPLRVETYGGLVFVNLDPDAVPLCEQAAKFLQDMYLCCPRLDELVRVERCEFDVAANWKTLVDNNHECYHCAVNHKSLMDLVDYDNKAVWREDGITFTHTVERKLLNGSAYAVDSKTLEQDALFGFIWPTQIPLFFPGTASMVMFQVLPRGVEKSRVRHDYFLLNRQANAQERAFMDWFSGTLALEDVSLCETVQRSLHSRGYRQGKFVVNRDHPEFSEHHVHFFQKLVYDALVT